MIHFIGIGAQKSGTSWAYTCLYEHPEICMPVKEIHFFSRDRYEKGIVWYESNFAQCTHNAKQGEWSTSYLYDSHTAERIYAHYPNAKLLVILRNPVDRAYSQYRNAIRAGDIPKIITFEAYAAQEKSVCEQGLYAAQLERYLSKFPREQLLVLLYEDIKKDPTRFMRTIYTFLGIDPTFVASMTHREVNIGRTPRYIGPERILHHISEFLRRHRLDGFVHRVRRTGITDLIRRINTDADTSSTNIAAHNELAKFFKEDTEKLSTILNRDMCTYWNI